MNRSKLVEAATELHRSENKKMEKGENEIFKNASELGRTLFSLEGPKKLAAFYIESGEKLAKQALEFQAKATEWAKDTPLAVVFAAQNSMGRKLVELSTVTRRRDPASPLHAFLPPL
jgi:hypothetical protein